VKTENASACVMVNCKVCIHLPEDDNHVKCVVQRQRCIVYSWEMGVNKSNHPI
jgi:hypothetical protein